MYGESFAQDGFRLFYQPIVWLRPTGEAVTIALEAFLRLQHPTQGLLLADSFLTLARENGEMNSLGQWVIHQACADLAGWRSQGFRGRVNVNIDPGELTPQYAESVRRALDAHGLAGDLLLLDISPDSPLVEDALTRQATDALRRLGVRLFMDDFGRGHATLKSLHEFTFAGIKFCRAPSDRDEPDALLLEELLELTDNTGRSLIVEHVETAAQKACVLALGCRTMQGYQFSEPIPAESVLGTVQALSAGRAVPVAPKVTPSGTGGTSVMPALV